MKERLIGLFNVKTEAINENIRSLNYLNTEKDKNINDLEFIEDKLKLLKPSEIEILNFSEINTYDFNKMLSMLDGEVSEVFSTKSCNYDGILYIIQGIKQGISLTLTEEQNHAILKLIESLVFKKENLLEVIREIERSKGNLPEIDLVSLENDLEKYNSIVSKFHENKYLTEIDEVIKVLDFCDIEVAERSEIFAYLLKYNADIYQKPVKVEHEGEYHQETEELDIKELQHEPINILDETFEEKDDSLEAEKSLINLDDTLKLSNPFSYPEDLELEEEKFKTTDLEDIIKKIDAKLALLDQQENKIEEVENDNLIPEISNDINLPNLEKTEEDKDLEAIQIPIEEISQEPLVENSKEVNLENKLVESVESVQELNQEKLKEKLVNYGVNLSLLSTFNSNASLNLENVENILSLLKNNQVLDKLNYHQEYLEKIILTQDEETLSNVIQIIKDKLALDDVNYQTILSIVIETIPTIFTSSKISQDFLSNIEFFQREQINLINLFDNYRELLIVETSYLEKNKEIITKYNFTLNNDDVKYLLYSNNLLEKLDYYIESRAREKGFLGTYEEFDGISYIKKYPYKLNDISKETLIKLKYAESIDKKIFGSKPGILSGEITNPKVDILEVPADVKNSYFDSSYEFLNLEEKENLKQEIKNIMEFDISIDDVIQKLDNTYKLNDLRYEINGLLFSRIKTIRLYNYLLKKNMEVKNALIFALTYNSVIKNDEYNKIVDLITKLLEGGM